jgi:spore coat polysaccharide biosynthesis protein SpsF
MTPGAARNLAAVLVCRCGSSRLYGKPLQNLDVEQGVTILDYMVGWMLKHPSYQTVMLAIAEGVENEVFVTAAERLGIPHFVGDEQDQLGRAIACADHFGATDITRYTTESPFTCFELIEDAWAEHLAGDFDASLLDHVPNGASFEILSLEALKTSHKRGDARHRSVGVSLYIREHRDEFRIRDVPVPEHLRRPEIRLTADNPEDLVLCRAVYMAFRDQAPMIPVAEMIRFLDRNPELKKLVEKYVDGGLETMYL